MGFNSGFKGLNVKELLPLEYCAYSTFSANSLVAKQNFEKRLFAASCSSVRLSAWNNLAPSGWIFMKFDI